MNWCFMTILLHILITVWSNSIQSSGHYYNLFNKCRIMSKTNYIPRLYFKTDFSEVTADTHSITSRLPITFVFKYCMFMFLLWFLFLHSPGLCKMMKNIPQGLTGAKCVLESRTIIQLQCNPNLGDKIYVYRRYTHTQAAHETCSRSHLANRNLAPVLGFN